MSAGKRKVSTDALETLGTIIGPDEKRDAIHLAVLPAKAGVSLIPGQSISLHSDRAMPDADGLAIVDPFLSRTVVVGERFWAVLKPRLVTSLRHVWTHPEFPDEPVAANGNGNEHEVWIRSFAADLGFTYDRLMAYAETWVECEEYTYDNSETYKAHWDKFPEFWSHYEAITGNAPKERESFFTCSC